MRPGRHRAASSLPDVTNASRAKRKRAAVRSAKRSRQNSWWYGLTAIVVIAGIALIAYTQATKPADVGPFLQNSSGTRQDTHWHAALGVYDCDHWMSDGSKPGAWNWPATTTGGSPARAENTSVYAGMHSHDYGVIHMEPVVSEEAGRNATVGLYFQFGGWKLNATSFSFLGTSVKNGDKCGTQAATLQWELGKWDGTNGKQKYAVQSGNPAKYKLFQGDIIVIAFLPPGKTLASIGDPPSVKNLETALGAENNSAAPTTMPAISTPASSTPASSTPTTAAKTSTSKP